MRKENIFNVINVQRVPITAAWFTAGVRLQSPQLLVSQSEISNSISGLHDIFQTTVASAEPLVNNLHLAPDR